MFLSVVICTTKFDFRLGNLLTKLCNQNASFEDFEVIVVFNGCSKTPGDFLSFQRGNCNIRAVVERRRSLSHARNVGLRWARGDFVAYLDDDVVVGADYVCRVIRITSDISDEVVCVVGPVFPLFEAKAPAWLLGKVESFYSLLNYGKKSMILDPLWRGIVGANMIFRRDFLMKVGGFDEDLGRQRGVLLSNEENLVKYKIMNKGLKIFYSPEIPVFHSIPDERLSLRWLYTRAYWQGISNFELDKKVNIFKYYHPLQLMMKAGLFFFLFPVLVLCVVCPSRFWEVVFVRCMAIIMVGYFVAIFLRR